jgi:hypothetical protein
LFKIAVSTCLPIPRGNHVYHEPPNTSPNLSHQREREPTTKVGWKADIEKRKRWADPEDRKPRCDWTLSQFVNSAPGMVDKLAFTDSPNNAAERLAETKALLEKWQRSWDEKAGQA